MQMTLGRRGDYAIRAVLHLARHPGQRRKARQIAEDMAIPPTYIPQILSDLVRLGIVSSQAGPEGGYELRHPASETSLLEVVEATSGAIESRECVLRGGPCRWEDACAVHETWASAQSAFREVLARTTFADLAEQDEMLERTDADRGRQVEIADGH
ncbi:MAG TPA: Rrf2 family transcriptional regulator [Nitriliruptorales bacterium]